MQEREDEDKNMSIVNLQNKTILVTGAAGFIGSNLVKRIYEEVPSATVIGIDNMNAYYDVALKEFRLKELAKYSTFTFVKGNIADKELITEIFEKYKPSIVVNLAAQAGVRYSITNPDAYVESNLVGFFNILEACRHSYDNGQTGVEHLVYASSSSVYGSNKKVPYSTDDKVDNPVSLYAATKKSNELMAHAYSKLYNIPSTGLRFFTVHCASVSLKIKYCIHHMLKHSRTCNYTLLCHMTDKENRDISALCNLHKRISTFPYLTNTSRC